MSGGSFDYLYYRIEETYENQFEDYEMNELLKDFCKVLHDLEWWKSADYGEDTYRKSVKAFKNKWFGKTEDERITKAIKNVSSEIEKKLKNIFGIIGE